MHKPALFCKNALVGRSRPRYPKRVRFRSKGRTITRLLADPDRAIQSECASAPKGAPSLPADNQRKLVSGDVSGTVLDLTGGPVANAKVTLCDRVIMTDSHGKYTFPNMPPGDCLLRAEKAGLSSQFIFECCEAHVVDAGTLLLALPVGRPKRPPPAGGL